VTPLAALDTWPVLHAAGAVVGPSGVLDAHGDATHRFALASVTKPLVAYAVLVAVEEGSLALDQPAGPPGATVRHLLAHASGLPFEGAAPVAAPATRRIYSNTGFEVLATLLRAATGMAVEDYLEEAVLGPLGMEATSLDGSPAAGATGTAEDLARFLHELLQPTLVHESTAAAMRAVTFPGLDGVLPGYGRMDPNDWGLGIEVRAHKSPHWSGAGNSPATVGHFGRSGTLVWVDPVAHLGLVALADREFGTWAVDAWPALADDVLAVHAPA
jgi:CubicO group peptidase (beta-lactamase class C family)